MENAVETMKVLAEIFRKEESRRKNPLIVFCGQDEKHLIALALEAYAERYIDHNGYVASGFAEFARIERLEH